MASGRDGVAGDPVTDGVGRIAGFVNSYTYRAGDETYLIDCSFSRTARPIVRAFERAGTPVERVRKILLTHHHVDHMGGAAYLVQSARAPLACHVDDAAFVDGRETAAMPLLMRLFVRIHPAPVAIPLHDGDRVGPLVVVHAPGHTPGEVAFYDPARKILFAGDSVVERKGRLILPGTRYASNLGQAVDSLEKLHRLDVEVLLPGHGVPVTRNFNALLEDLIERAPREYLHRA